MHEFARGIGLLYLVSGAFLLAAPEPARKVMHLREELAHLSSGALRLLGGWTLMMGVLLMVLSVRPTMEARVSEVIPSEHRRAA